MLTPLLRLFALVGFLLVLLAVTVGGNLDAPWLLPASGAALALAALLGAETRGGG